MSSKLLKGELPISIVPIPWRVVEAAATRAGPDQPKPERFESPAEVEARSEQRLRAAREAGLREGEAAGRSRASAELQPVMERLARSIVEIGRLRARLRREAEADLLRLALAIARRVLRRELTIDPEAMHGLVLGALEKLQGQELCRVRVHPAHAPLLQECLKQSRPGAQVEVIADPSAESGAVIFETERGSLDASTESQLGEIERGLADRLRRQA